MRRPRLRLSSLMILVALIAVGLWSGLLWSRAQSYRVRAEAFAACWDLNMAQSLMAIQRGQEARRTYQRSEDPERRVALARSMTDELERAGDYRRAAEWCDRMEARYQIAARRPWISVSEGERFRPDHVDVFLPPPR